MDRGADCKRFGSTVGKRICARSPPVLRKWSFKLVAVCHTLAQMTSPPDKSSEKAEAFVARWQGQEGGQERANYTLFLTELCDVLDLPHADPAGATRERNHYC